MQWAVVKSCCFYWSTIITVSTRRRLQIYIDRTSRDPAGSAWTRLPAQTKSRGYRTLTCDILSCGPRHGQLWTAAPDHKNRTMRRKGGPDVSGRISPTRGVTTSTFKVDSRWNETPLIIRTNKILLNSQRPARVDLVEQYMSAPTVDVDD